MMLVRRPSLDLEYSHHIVQLSGIKMCGANVGQHRVPRFELGCLGIQQYQRNEYF